MPYRGRQSGQTAAALQRGLQVGSALREQRSGEAARLVQQELQKAYLELAKDREARAAKREGEEDKRAASADARANARSRMEGLAFEQGQLDRSKARRTESQLGEAMTGTSVGNVYSLIRQYPELAPEAKTASAMAAKLTDPKAKAVFAQAFEQSLTQKAQEIDLDRAEQRFNDDFSRGVFNGSDGQPDEKALGAMQLARDGIRLYRESGGKQGLTGKQAVDTVHKVVLEGAKNEALAQARRMDAEEMRTTFGAQLKGQARAQFLTAVNAYERLGEDSGLDSDKLTQLGMELANPMQGKQDPREKARADLLSRLLSGTEVEVEDIPARLKMFEDQMGLSQPVAPDPKAYAEELKARGVSREEFNRLMKEAFPAGNK